MLLFEAEYFFLTCSVFKFESVFHMLKRLIACRKVQVKGSCYTDVLCLAFVPFAAALVGTGDLGWVELMTVCTPGSAGDRSQRARGGFSGAGEATGLRWCVRVASVLYTGIISLRFTFSDLGDPLHASTVALCDLPDPF